MHLDERSRAVFSSIQALAIEAKTSRQNKYEGDPRQGSYRLDLSGNLPSSSFLPLGADVSFRVASPAPTLPGWKEGTSTCLASCRPVFGNCPSASWFLLASNQCEPAYTIGSEVAVGSR